MNSPAKPSASAALAQLLAKMRGGTPVSSVSTRAGKLAYWSEGKGPPVVLLHGNSAGKEVFASQMKFLAAADYRAVAFDLPGHGESSNAMMPERDYPVNGYAGTIREAMAKLDLSGAIVIGWSLGGHIAIEMAGRGFPVSGLVLSGTPPCGPGVAEMSATFLPIPALEVAAKDDPTPAELANYVAHIYKRLDPLPDAFIALAARSDGKARNIMMGTALAGEQGCHQRTVIRGWLNPIAVLQGAEEPFFPNSVLQDLGWRNLWRNQIVEIPGAAHAPFVEAPDVFNEHLGAFLKEKYPR